MESFEIEDADFFNDKKIIENAERRIDRMSPEQIENFIEKQTGGRTR